MTAIVLVSVMNHYPINGSVYFETACILFIEEAHRGILVQVQMKADHMNELSADGSVNQSS